QKYKDSQINFTPQEERPSFRIVFVNFTGNKPRLGQAAPRQNASKLAFALGLHYLCRKITSSRTHGKINDRLRQRRGRTPE
uniref:hypothetical protein n=1 Tax=Alistipes shahii TaxID=328814 RepID=UPI003FF108AB